MKKIVFLLLAIPVLFIAACGSKPVDQTTGQTCVEWNDVLAKVSSSDALLKENSAIMSSPKCETVDKAIQASTQLTELAQWFDTNLCKTSCYADQPNKQNICKNINVDSMTQRTKVLVAAKATMCK